MAVLAESHAVLSDFTMGENHVRCGIEEVHYTGGRKPNGYIRYPVTNWKDKGMLNQTSEDILFFIHDLERGGPELRLLNFARYFPKSLNIHICVMSEDLLLFDQFVASRANICVEPIKKIYFSLAKILRIVRYINENNIKIINSFDLKGLLISLFARMISTKRPLVVYHIINALSDFSPRQKKFFLPTIRFSDAVICNSYFSREQFERRYFSKIMHVIYNGVDTRYFRKPFESCKDLKKSLGIREDDIVLGTIANFRQQKNYPFLISAFELLSQRNSHLKLICVGGGQYFNEIRRMVSEKGLKDRVVLTGFSEKTKEYLSIMDIFALVSLYEGLPNSLMEAMSMGIPIVASAVGGCLELISQMHSGILFPVNDTEEFVQAIEKLILDKRLAYSLGANARLTVQDKFSLRSMVQNYVNFFEKQLAGAK